jgi:hypothetical protein
MPNILPLTDDAQKIITLIGAVIAAAASLLNLWWTHRTKVDRIVVQFGPTRPPIGPGEWLHIVSQSDHQINLRDYGFVGPTGALLSLPLLDADSPGDEDDGVGLRGKTTFEKRGDIFEIGPVKLGGQQIGAYAVTLGSERYVVGFNYDVPLLKRLVLRLKIKTKPAYL